ncbi:MULTISPECIES: hypothetical protein [unclassified Mesorhizobium]|uniref:hypothetical protein n=1 Tax=unclassified Mesorhizobium TaxID=325217 RepID=UPI000FD85628|nr:MULTISPECIES: hypothetical protein [unclassified Mesorhizobium]TGQ34674.1 hypothetical protein EN859_024870 [Mesorhizobium sp. M00.F.Ca.ET.216.01.1.1]TIS57594.1 MAG: hypothetical protein E5W91_13620 [Mesorhizobium sp.]TIS88629.1 MAG: hypothetical protein E5W89_19915 [Mesorhizobium sp.]TJW43506.1 MAG: hypothetical protein E5W83_17160 [Mesorhizobium sp.]
MAIETTERVVEFAREQLKHQIRDVLDDPSRLTTMPEELIANYFNEARLLAADLGLDFDLLVDEMGTDHERDRLRRLESSAAVSPPEGPDQ